MGDPVDEERVTRIRQARQVLAGNEIVAPEDSPAFGNRFAFAAPGDLVYFLVLAVLILLAAIVYAVWGLGAASPVLLLLALGLILGWFIL